MIDRQGAELLEARGTDRYGRTREEIVEQAARAAAHAAALDAVIVDMETTELGAKRRRLLRGREVGPKRVGPKAAKRLRTYQGGLELLAQRDHELAGLPWPADGTVPPTGSNGVRLVMACPRCGSPRFGVAELTEHLRERHGLTEVESRTLAYAHGMEQSGVEQQPTDSQSVGADRLAPP